MEPIEKGLKHLISCLRRNEKKRRDEEGRNRYRRRKEIGMEDQAEIMSSRQLIRRK